MFFVKYFGPFDLFRQPFYLLAAKNRLTATRFGLFLSGLIYILLGYFFFQSDFFVKLKPKIVLDTTSFSSSPFIEYKNRPFAFSIRNLEGGAFSDPSYFNFKVQRVSQTQERKNGSQVSITQITQKTFHLCRENDTASYDEYLLIKDSFCLDENHFSLTGGKGEINTTNFQILINMCQNTTENGNFCKSPDEINDFFILKNLNLFYRNTLFQPNNYNTPTLPKYLSPLYSLDSKLTRLITIKFQKASIITDDGIIFSSTKTDETFVFESESTDFGLSHSSNTPIATVIFFSSSNVLTLSRNYQSLPEAAAVLGGLFSVLMIAGKMVSQMDKAIYLTTLLMNMLYSFQEPINRTLEKQHTLTRKTVFGSEIGNRESGVFMPDTLLFQRKTMTKERRSVSIKDPPIVDFNEEMESPTKTERDSPLKNDKETTERMVELATPVMTNSQENKRTNAPDHLPLKILKEEETFDDEQIVSQEVALEKVESDSAIGGAKRRMGMSNQILDLKIRKPRSFLGNISQHLHFFKNTIKDEKEMKSLKEFLTFKEQTHKIKFNFFDFLKLAVKSIVRLKKTFVERLFLRAQKVFEKEIDIVKILKRIQDIEKLKYLLMSEKQIALFDVLEKPMIYLDEEAPMDGSSFILKSKKTSVKEDINHAYNYYLELEKRRDDLEPIDLKLFMLVDKRFKTYKRYFKKDD